MNPSPDKPVTIEALREQFLASVLKKHQAKLTPTQAFDSACAQLRHDIATCVIDGALGKQLLAEVGSAAPGLPADPFGNLRRLVKG